MIQRLKAFAVAKIELSEEIDGIPLEKHLISHWMQSGVIPDQLNYEPLPYEIEYLWEWWLELQKTRPMGMGEGHITYTELDRWAFLLKINISPLEVRCIMALDSAYMACRASQRKREAASK